MPQMSPMWWETLFILFMMMYLMTNMLMYWTKEIKMKSKNTGTKNNKEMDWKL